MGSIKTKDIKRAAEHLREQNPEKFGLDFEKNKESLNELNLSLEKRARNRIAGYMARQTKVDAIRAVMKNRPYVEPQRRDRDMDDRGRRDDRRRYE